MKIPFALVTFIALTGALAQQAKKPAGAADPVEKLKAAAAQGDASAANELGTLYAAGKGLPRNYPEAVKWFGCGYFRTTANGL